VPAWLSHDGAGFADRLESEQEVREAAFAMGMGLFVVRLFHISGNANAERIRGIYYGFGIEKEVVVREGVRSRVEVKRPIFGRRGALEPTAAWPQGPQSGGSPASTCHSSSSPVRRRHQELKV
jgi:hypothetical protein